MSAIKDAIWEVLEDYLERSDILPLDLNDPDDNQKFCKLVDDLTVAVETTI